MSYNRTLDGLRGIAILLVLLFHFQFILGLGWIGVQLFFVLSGYLITSILLSGKENTLSYYLKRFYWRRTLRIFPLYFAYLFLVSLAFLIARKPEDFPEMFPFLATYTFNFFPLAATYSFQDYFFTHFWSLSVEEQFYLIWPFVIFFCSRKQLQTLLIVIIFLAPVVRFVLADILLNRGYDAQYTGEIVYRFTLSQLDGFAFGALIPVFSFQRSQIRTGRLMLVVAGLLAALGLLNLYQLQADGQSVTLSSLGYHIGGLINYQHVWSYTLFNCLFFLAILHIVRPTPAKKSLTDLIIGNSVLVYFGKISYGLYVYHWIIWMAFGKFAGNLVETQALGFLAYLATCTIVASASFFFFERPILGFKDKFFKMNTNPIINEQVTTSV